MNDQIWSRHAGSGTSAGEHLEMTAERLQRVATCRYPLPCSADIAAAPHLTSAPPMRINRVSSNACTSLQHTLAEQSVRGSGSGCSAKAMAWMHATGAHLIVHLNLRAQDHRSERANCSSRRHCRQRAGVIPRRFTNVRVRWLWSEKPTIERDLRQWENGTVDQGTCHGEPLLNQPGIRRYAHCAAKRLDEIAWRHHRDSFRQVGASQTKPTRNHGDHLSLQLHHVLGHDLA